MTTESQHRPLRQTFLSIILMLAWAASVLAACQGQPAAPATATVEPTPLPTLTLVPTAASIPQPIYRRDIADLNVLLASPELKVKYDALLLWYRYWVTASDQARLFKDAASVQIAFKEDTDKPGTGTFVLESAEYPGMMILTPMRSWKDNAPPPAGEPGHELDPSNRAYTISKTVTAELSQQSKIPAGAQVVYRKAEWEAYLGNDLVGKMSGEGAWQKVETVDWSKAFFVPEYYTDISINNMLASPEFGTPDFDLWFIKLTNLMLEKNLPYTIFSSALGSDTQKGYMELFDIKALKEPALGSFLLRMQGRMQTVLILKFVVKGWQGDKINNATDGKLIAMVLPPSSCALGNSKMRITNDGEQLDRLWRPKVTWVLSIRFLLKGSGTAWDGQDCELLTTVADNSTQYSKIFDPDQINSPMFMTIGWVGGWFK